MLWPAVPAPRRDRHLRGPCFGTSVMTENIIIAAIIILGLFVAGPMLLYYLVFGKLS